ncbi:hypothetical protein H257_03428 [Aphanomyces astaci]|uniref:DDE-1 domain-containing protein n=1 Tax=Aphanomyces astaci TaxID=112090 RepID=W4GYY2_APHAT|nr:hypothetical protein H257_03428 [Aphanomyces astaci]ETV84118.1 hypothetical protein H257_03428 [Aphanomyces astaci]|eukprot:XP_009825810.1 hypothetical protein H257_03428 [Aphanomyces astaci]
MASPCKEALVHARRPEASSPAGRWWNAWDRSRSRCHIPYEVVMRRVRLIKASKEVRVQRRGPKPTLAKSCEEDLRHPQLTNRVAQVISSARTSIDEAGVALLFDSMGEAMKEHNFTADRIFNMDETSFASRRKSKDVVALKGSRNVWAKTVPTNFHMSIVACGSADGMILPPLFFCLVNLSTRTWVPTVRYLVLLSLRPRKETGDMHSISKAAAITIASNAWTSHILSSNVVSGFRTAGLFPLSLEQMMKRFNLFQKGGVPAAYVHAEWLEQQDALRRQLLALPAEQAKRVGPKRITVAGRILTLALMQVIDKTKEERAKAAKETKALKAKRAKRKAKRRTCDDDNAAETEEDNEGPPDNEGTQVAKATKPVTAKRAKHKAKRRTCDVDDVDGAATAQDDDEGPPDSERTQDTARDQQDQGPPTALDRVVLQEAAV